MERYTCDVCIVGGGPSGMILGLLLAAKGVSVLVVESHHNFDREYRGEVLQPRFVQMMDQLNLRTYIESFPHLKLDRGELFYHNKAIAAIDFGRLSDVAPYALWMPQPILLQALYEKSLTYPKFNMWFQASLKQLMNEGEQVVGAVVEHNGERIEVQAKVTVGADGRYSTVRRLGNFEFEYEHYENDVVWFTTQKPNDWDNTFRLLISKRHLYLLLPKYPDAIQGGITMAKGEWQQVKSAGIGKMQSELRQAGSLFVPFADSLVDFTPFVLLQAKIHYVRNWAKDGCLLVGDAAHCASPVGAVGVSLSVGTAIVAAEVILNGLASGDVSANALRAVQELREVDVRSVHSLQRKAEKIMLSNRPMMRALRPHVVSWLAKTPLGRWGPQRFFIMAKPLPISSHLRIEA